MVKMKLLQLAGPKALAESISFRFGSEDRRDQSQSKPFLNWQGTLFCDQWQVL